MKMEILKSFKIIEVITYFTILIEITLLKEVSTNYWKMCLGSNQAKDLLLNKFLSMIGLKMLLRT
jgi:hypothetical protein